MVVHSGLPMHFVISPLALVSEILAVENSLSMCLVILALSIVPVLIHKVLRSGTTDATPTNPTGFLS